MQAESISFSETVPSPTKKDTVTWRVYSDSYYAYQNQHAEAMRPFDVQDTTVCSKVLIYVDAAQRWFYQYEHDRAALLHHIRLRDLDGRRQFPILLNLFIKTLFPFFCTLTFAVHPCCDVGRESEESAHPVRVAWICFGCERCRVDRGNGQ